MLHPLIQKKSKGLFMKLPLQVTFRNLEPTESLENDIQKKAEKLERFFDQIMSCRVVMEANHKHQHKGNLYHVRIDITVPGHEIVVSKESHDKKAHEDAYVAIRDAFEAAKRQLEDLNRKRRQQIKTHDAPPHGRVIHLSPQEDYGRIGTPDGREVYFHRNSMLNGDFDKLEIGNEVRYAEEMGEEGPQASTVAIIGKHHIVSRQD
jgi:ribosomal subunit interface protein